MAAETTKTTELERGSTVFSDLAASYRETAGGTIRANRLVAINSSGLVVEASANDTAVVGNLRQSTSAASGDLVPVGFGRTVLESATIITAGQKLKSAADGQAIQLVDSALTGTTIKTTGVGEAFTNQPANDGVEVVSASAGDTTQTITIIGTTTGTDTVVVETVTLNGTTPVPTVKVDWGVVLAWKKSATTAGNVTIREASADQTIATSTTTDLSGGVETVTAGATQYAYNAIPTGVSDGATTKQIGIQGTNSAGATIYDSQALNGTTAVTFNSSFLTVTEVYTGDLESGRIATIKVGAEDDEHLGVGRALRAAAAASTIFDALVFPT